MAVYMTHETVGFVAAVRAAVPELTWHADSSGSVVSYLADGLSVVVLSLDDSDCGGTLVTAQDVEGCTVGPVVTLHEMSLYSTHPGHVVELAAAVRYVVSRAVAG